MDGNIRSGYGGGANFGEGSSVLGANDMFGDESDVAISVAQADFDAGCYAVPAPFETVHHEDFDFSDIMLKYIGDILMEEEENEEIQDVEGLQAAERSFYEVLGQNYPPLPDQPVVSLTSTEEGVESYRSGDAIVDEYLFPHWDFGDCEAAEEVPAGLVSQSNSQSSGGSPSRSCSSADVTVNSPVSTPRVPEIFTDVQSIKQFERGVKEASKFLPNCNDLLANVGYDGLPGNTPPAPIQGRKSMRKRNTHQEEEGNSNKLAAVYSEPTALKREIFDMVLLSTEGVSESALRESLQSIKAARNSTSSKGSSGGKSRDKKWRGKRGEVDLMSLLKLCANSIVMGDLKFSNELLKQIREHSSPTGDGMQRMAHYFANGLEARINGTGAEIYKALMSLPASGSSRRRARKQQGCI